MSEAQMLFSESDVSSPARVLVVAEIGVNHDGQAARGLELIEAASGAGADAVKLQMFRPDRLLSEQAGLADYQRGQARDAKALLASLALERSVIKNLGQAAREAGLKFIVTPFSLRDVDDLRGMDVDAVKIASPDAVNTPLLKAARGLGKPMLISTGTCELEELVPAAGLLKRHRAGGCLLQCVSSYPTPLEDSALGAMAALRDRFGLAVGYSDHTQETLTGALAVAAGAVVLEKHLTYDTQATGPDHAASLDPAGLAQYVRRVRQAQSMLGPKCKQALPIERDVRTVSRQSVCATRDMPVGHRLGPEDLTVKRPGTGIPAAKLEDVIGQTLARAVHADHLLTQADLTTCLPGEPARPRG